MLALVVTGTIETKSWVNSEPREVSFHDLKGIVQQLAAVGMEIRPSKENAGVNRAEMTPCAEIIVRGKTIGLLGQLRPALARKLGATSPIFCAELSIEALQQAANGKRGFTPPPEFPSSARDIAFVVPQSLHYAAILKEIRAAKQALLTEVEAFDVYRDPTGKHLPVDAKSLAVRLVFRSTERTLKHEEVETATEAIRSVLRSRLGAVFRE